MNHLRRFGLASAVFFLFFLRLSALWAEPASETWTLEKCLSWGLQNHPALVQSENAVSIAESRVGQVRAGRSVKVSAGAGWTRRRQEYSRATAGRIGGSDDLTDSTSESLTARKLLADSGQTHDRVRAAEGSTQASRRDLEWQRVQLAGEIKMAYYQAMQARALIEVRRESLARFEEHLGKVRGFVEVGNRPPYDITKAEADVANARVEVIRAEKNYRNAVANLAESVGFQGGLLVAEASESIALPPAPALDREQLFREAMQRPDVQALAARITVAGHQLSESRKGLKPTLSGSANYNWSGTVSPLDRSWNVGVSLEYPLFDGRLTQHQIAESKSNLQSVHARRDQLELSIQTEMEIALNGIVEAFQRLDAVRTLMQQASETLNLAEGRYTAGVGSPIEVTDARNTYVAAAGDLVTAQYDVLIALARLDRNLGRFPHELKVSLHQDVMMNQPGQIPEATPVEPTPATASSTAAPGPAGD